MRSSNAGITVVVHIITWTNSRSLAAELSSAASDNPDINKDRSNIASNWFPWRARIHALKLFEFFKSDRDFSYKLAVELLPPR